MSTENLPTPHGGVLKSVKVGPAGGFGRSQRLELSQRQYADLEMISIGAYSPLEGYMGESDYLSVIDSMRLSDGTLWSIPITLQLHADQLERVVESLELVRDGVHLATLGITERFALDLETESGKVYGTTSTDHPGVRMLSEGGTVAVAGELTLHVAPRAHLGSEYFTPEEAREAFSSRGWRTVAAFQTRNPVHRAHEYLHKVALEVVDGLFLNPLVGHTKSDDVPAAARMEAYKVLLDNYYPADRALLGVYPAAMRYAGPKEAILHALSRKNYGCTHFIVGRDHAGVGDFYGTYASQEIFDTLDPSELGIEILRFEHSFYCSRCGQVASKRTCPHGSEHHVALSGTKVRELLSSGGHLPPEFSRPEVAEVLRSAYARPRNDA